MCCRYFSDQDGVALWQYSRWLIDQSLPLRLTILMVTGLVHPAATPGRRCPWPCECLALVGGYLHGFSFLATMLQWEEGKRKRSSSRSRSCMIAMVGSLQKLAPAYLGLNASKIQSRRGPDAKVGRGVFLISGRCSYQWAIRHRQRTKGLFSA